MIFSKCTPAANPSVDHIAFPFLWKDQAGNIWLRGETSDVCLLASTKGFSIGDSTKKETWDIHAWGRRLSDYTVLSLSNGQL